MGDKTVKKIKVMVSSAYLKALIAKMLHLHSLMKP